MGHTHGNLLVIDCETEVSFFHHKNLLEKHDITIWTARTGGNNGGGHFYLRCEEGEVKGYQSKDNDFEVRGGRCYVLAPPSLHPDGGHHDSG